MGKKEESEKGKQIEEMEEQKSKGGFPFCVFFILGNEFCERYSFYGMRTILVLYLRYYLKWDDDTATAVYHAFTVLAYLFPLLGAMIADSWWGKYKTILWLSVVYSVGMIINTLGAIGDLGDLVVHAVLSSIGLFVIAFGTGGIKPCVSAFGGDQFTADQDDYRRRFFSLFYFAINAGSLVSTFVSPIIRDEVQCFGDDCYALAFGIPAALMIIAIVSFVIGTRWYNRIEPTGNIFAAVCKTIWRAWRVRWNIPSKQRDKDHWLDYANDGTNSILIRDIKYVLKVLLIFIPLPVFWALFDQQGSRWTLQAIRMNGEVGGGVTLLPDQVQILNPLVIIALIPLFEATLYPCLRKYKINFSPLKRMTVGMFLAGLAFVVAALIQMMIDENLTLTPGNMKQSSLRVINAANCNVTVKSELYEWDNAVVPSEQTSDTLETFVAPGKYNVEFGCGDKYTEEVNLIGLEATDFIISDSGINTLKSFETVHPVDKSDSGKAFVGVVNTLKSEIWVSTITHKGEFIQYRVESNRRIEMSELKQREYEMLVIVNNGTSDEFKIAYNFNVYTGGLYTIVVRTNKPMPSGADLTTNDIDFTQYTDVYPNDVSIFWMIPQYFIITLGEVFLSVTGLEFSYSQAPPSMKSVLTSFWLLTVSIGNIIVLIIAEAKFFPKQVDEYFLFAGLIAAAAIIFIFLAMGYEYVDESEFALTSEEEAEEEEKRRETTRDVGSAKRNRIYENHAFDHNTEM